MEGLHALFTGEDNTWEAWLNVDPSGLSGIVGYTGNGIKLRRGYAGSYSPKPTQVLTNYSGTYSHISFLRSH